MPRRLLAMLMFFLKLGGTLTFLRFGFTWIPHNVFSQ